MHIICSGLKLYHQTILCGSERVKIGGSPAGDGGRGRGGGCLLKSVGFAIRTY